MNTHDVHATLQHPTTASDSSILAASAAAARASAVRMAPISSLHPSCLIALDNSELFCLPAWHEVLVLIEEVHCCLCKACVQLVNCLLARMVLLGHCKHPQHPLNTGSAVLTPRFINLLGVGLHASKDPLISLCSNVHSEAYATGKLVSQLRVVVSDTWQSAGCHNITRRMWFSLRFRGTGGGHMLACLGLACQQGR